MSGLRPMNERGRWASQLRRVVLVVALAVASSALLPLVHGGANHIGDCGVCIAIAHGASASLDTVSVADYAYVGELRELASVELELVLPRRDRDVCAARAPPAVTA